MPEGVSTAVHIFGSQARDEILHQLALAGPLTAAELAERIGATRKAALEHLKTLEARGLVSADVPAESRPGRELRWTVDRGRVEQMLDELAAYLLPPD
jgi:predicted ArsR family transcriptional regulator